MDLLRGAGQSGYRRYRTNMRHHINPALGNVALSRLTALQIQNLYNQKLNAGLSSSSVQNIHTVLHSALKEAAQLGLVQRNVADMARKPARRRTKTATLSEEQVQIFLKAIKGNRLEALYILALSTGMREGELLGLSWSDVDLEHGALQVSLSLQESDGPVRRVLGEPKTSYSRRRISLSKAAIWALCRHRERQEMARLRGREVADPKYDLVFPNLLGRPLHPSHLLRRQFRPLLQRAGLPPIRFHDLRHTAATLLLGRGINPKIVSEMLGHANVRITLDIYSHVMPDMQQRAAQAMDDIFGPRGGNDDTVD
ncbi:MAG TPA: tyrosine-type recombinase/integrase [Ktedonobacterales bacterium]|nr:tyrosine-type recombinase/integrase [Ktedonobacterales bacterium]